MFDLGFIFIPIIAYSGISIIIVACVASGHKMRRYRNEKIINLRKYKDREEKRREINKKLEIKELLKKSSKNY